MKVDPGAQLRELMREDFATFAMRAIAEIEPALDLQWNWHHDVLVDRLMMLARGDITRLIVCVPPRSLKSLICSVAYPAWLLGQYPALAVACVSYAQPLSEGFARQCRTVMESGFYRETFETRIRGDRRAVEDFMTTGGGRRFATSVGGTFTGRGGDVIILDDPMKPEEALSEAGRNAVLTWLRNTLMSRLNSKKDGRMLVVMQRLHEQDLAAALLEQGGWELLSLPAIADVDEEHRYSTIFGSEVTRRKIGEALHPERESLAVLEELRTNMGAMTFSAQYLQAPVPADGNLVKRSWFRSHVPADVVTLDRVVQSWDTALTTGIGSDFSVGITLGTRGKDIYILDVVRGRMDFPDLRRAVLAAAERWKPATVLIEDRGSGTSLAQDLTAGGMRNIKLIVPDRDKISRLAGAALLIEQGQVFVPENAPWLDAFIAEITAFPVGRNDDQVDALSQALAWVRDNLSEPHLLTYYRELYERQQRGEG